MDKKSKILIAVFVVLIIISVFLTYKRAFIDRNFEIINGKTTTEKREEKIRIAPTPRPS